MNNVLSNNASDLAISTNTPENYPFLERIVKIAARKTGASGLTIASVTVNRNALVSAVCKDFRDTYPSLFAKRDDKGNIIDAINRVPEQFYDKIVEQVDLFLEQKFQEFTKNDCKVASVRFVHQASKKDVFLRHTLVRDEVIDFKQRLLGIDLFIGETKRQINKVNSQQSVLSEKTEERLKKLEKRLEREMETRNALAIEVAKQKTLS
jgi:hypothetical protein